jgi:probable HAF family extracellular repeat protein
MRLTQLRSIFLGLGFALAAGAAVAQTPSLNFLATDGARYWAPSDINNRGQIVGTVGDSHFPFAVTWDARTPGRLAYLPTYADCCTYIASYGHAINDRGQFAGDDTGRAALWNGLTRPTLLMGEVLPSTARDLNNSGAVVGTFGGRATVWDAAGTHHLGTLGGTSEGHAINEAGTVVGMSVVPGPTYQPHAALWRNGTVTDLGEGVAYNLNDRGLVVGMSDQRATLWNGTQATFLDGYGSVAADVNNRGWVVGSLEDEVSGDPMSAMLWYGGRSIDLNSFLSQAQRDEGWRLVAATAINDHGWIVGSAFNAETFTGRGFVLSIPAIPEPGSLALLAAGLGVIGAVRRRQRRGQVA